MFFVPLAVSIEVLLWTATASPILPSCCSTRGMLRTAGAVPKEGRSSTNMWLTVAFIDAPSAPSQTALLRISGPIMHWHYWTEMLPGPSRYSTGYYGQLSIPAHPNPSFPHKGDHYACHCGMKKAHAHTRAHGASVSVQQNRIFCYNNQNWPLSQRKNVWISMLFSLITDSLFQQKRKESCPEIWMPVFGVDVKQIWNVRKAKTMEKDPYQGYSCPRSTIQVYIALAIKCMQVISLMDPLFLNSNHTITKTIS